MKKLFDINVRITGFNQVKTDTTTVNFITFDGDCQAPFFTGKILDGGVDTQKFEKGKPGTLSARYIIKGKDNKGQETSLFIENNGFVNEDGSIETSPFILCDNDELAPLFSKKLTGRIKNVDCPEKNRIIIEIYTE
jgi:hypothetical protein